MMACILHVTLFCIMFNCCLSIPFDTSLKWAHLVQSVENSLPENFWTRARFEKAMANDGERILHNDQFLSTTNRKRRSTDDNFWTPERIRKTKDNVPESNPGNQTAPQSRMVLLLSSQLTSQPILHADINIEPWKHYGKLLFTSQSRNGIWEEGTCSAAFVDRQVIITAAHCVINSRGWHRTFQFDHRYNTNNRRGRLVKIHKIYLPKDYNTFTDSNPHGNLSVDYAFLTTFNSSQDGFLDMKFSHTGGLISAAGYPKEPPYDGEKLLYTEGTKGEDTGDPTKIYFHMNNLSGGSSGGPWLMNDSGKFHVIGLNSHRYVGCTTMISPKFNSMTAELFDYVSNQAKLDEIELARSRCQCTNICGNNSFQGECVLKHLPEFSCQCLCKCSPS